MQGLNINRGINLVQEEAPNDKTDIGESSLLARIDHAYTDDDTRTFEVQ